MKNVKWDKVVDKLDFAFQPIVNITNGQIYGVEALLRNFKEAGDFHSIINCFDEAFQDGYLYQLDLKLREKAFIKFKTINVQNLKLFYNIDSRIIYLPEYKSGNTLALLKMFNLTKNKFCFEVSERKTLQDPNIIKNMINRYKYDGFDIAVDNFGTGVSGLQVLYYAETTYIKLDRFYIDNLDKESKKRLFFSSIVNMAHIMGIKVVAEGIENVKEYYILKDIGVDYIQGYLVQKPKRDLSKIKYKYNHIDKLYNNDRRSSKSNIIAKDYIDYIDPIEKSTTFHDVIVYFKKNTDNSFAPIVDEHNNLLGVIYDSDIKKITYSQYGMALSKNSAYRGKLEEFMRPALSVERYWGVDKTLEVFNMSNNGVNGIFITTGGVYYGFINVNNLLSMSYNRNLEIAQNQNPLTKLPGNSLIQHFINKSFKSERKNYLCYFDFNDFKPFNDYYGFRQGDRAILMFAETLKRLLNNDVFVGHIGGDDFFVGFEEGEKYGFEKVYDILENIQRDFKSLAKTLYKEEDRERGYIIAKDRFGTEREFELLSVSCVLVEIKNLIDSLYFDNILGELKKSSKKVDRPYSTTLINIG